MNDYPCKYEQINALKALDLWSRRVSRILTQVPQNLLFPEMSLECRTLASDFLRLM